MEDLPNPTATAEIVEMTRGTQPTSGLRNNYTSGNIQRAALPAVLDVPQAARLLGIGRTLAYELVRTNQWPTPVIRMGRLIKIPSGPIMELMTTGAAAHRQTAS
jgi:predicted DNA-binding transcriptional regulator AlpA